MDEHGGELRIEPGAEGGTRVTLWFPLDTGFNPTAPKEHA
jgi:hypothetical protein